ncbi:hypothetical protein WR25_22472 [Diploscapter pachys]|uniref:Uncharacterized protein n=1 Tax=Diploscapter pachys TaxID=2018661 RepID=A0A2A2KDP6_9BILA|nr:hypothetical protein WR25_22472 [Diploscapter pachys]
MLEDQEAQDNPDAVSSEIEIIRSNDAYNLIFSRTRRKERSSCSWKTRKSWGQPGIDGGLPGIPDQEKMVCQESQDSQESQDQTRLTAPAQQDPATTRPGDTGNTKLWFSGRAGDEHPKTNIISPPSILSSLASFFLLFVSLSSTSNLSPKNVEHHKLHLQF